MNIKLKRIICILLVISLLFSLTGCVAEAVAVIDHLGTTLLVLAGVLPITALAYGLNVLTQPFIEKTGWCVCQLTVDLAKGWKKLVDPRNLMDDWSYMEKDQVSFHEEHLEILSGLESVTEEQDRFLAGSPDQSAEKKSLFDKLFGCSHKKLTYDPETFAVSCRCGDITKDDLSFEAFEPYVPKGFFRSKKKQYSYALKEYNRYCAHQQGIDPDVMSFLTQMNVPALTEENREKLSQITGYLGDMAETVSTGGEVDDGFAKGLALPTNFFSNVDKYFGYANTFLTLVKAGTDMQSAETYLQTPGKETEAVHSTIEVLKSSTSFIPVASVVFDEMLDTVEKGINSVRQNMRYDLVGKTARDAVLYGTAFANVHNQWYVENRDLWEEGPALKDLANAGLSKEELYGLAPYIEYRVDLEIESVLGVTLDEMISAYTKNSN